MKIKILKILKLLFKLIIKDSKTVNDLFEDSIAFFENNIGLEFSEYIMLKKFTKNYNSEKSVLIDIGANEGQFMGAYLKFVPNQKIIAFEPIQTLALKLSKKYNYLSDQIVIRNQGVGDDNTTLFINKYKYSGLSSFLPLSQIGVEDYKGKKMEVEIEDRISVEVVKLDFLFSKIENVKYILKIDTQGFELNVLKGAQQLFNETKIEAVIIELMFIKKYEDSQKYYQVMDFLENNGMKLFDLRGHFYNEHEELTEGNAIYVRK